MPPSIPFNKPFIAGRELSYIAQAVTLGQLSGDGAFTQMCCRLLEERFRIPDSLLTPSCTAALELSAPLRNFGVDDDVLMPSYAALATTASAVVNFHELVTPGTRQLLERGNAG